MGSNVKISCIGMRTCEVGRTSHERRGSLGISIGINCLCELDPLLLSLGSLRLSSVSVLVLASLHCCKLVGKVLDLMLHIYIVRVSNQ